MRSASAAPIAPEASRIPRRRLTADVCTRRGRGRSPARNLFLAELEGAVVAQLLAPGLAFAWLPASGAIGGRSCSIAVEPLESDAIALDPRRIGRDSRSICCSP